MIFAAAASATCWSAPDITNDYEEERESDEEDDEDEEESEGLLLNKFYFTIRSFRKALSRFHPTSH